MGKSGVILGAILIIFGLILFPILLDSFEELERSETTTSATLPTTAPATAGNVTLGYELYSDNLDSVIDITSTNTSDDPAPSVYYTLTQNLTVSGLETDATRTISISYYTDRDTGTLSTFLPIAPFLIFIAFILGGVGLIYSSMRR